MATVEERIAAAEERLKKLKDQKAKIEARKRAVKARQDRAADTRRKVLIGAFVLDQMERAGIGAALLTYEGQRFSQWLTRPQDRALFGLAERDEGVPATAPTERQAHSSGGLLNTIRRRTIDLGG